ncbi:unnamed protein product [Mytilus coruscus]|uniref:B box-type domain-containing protein n=1 Tax=Mytilus coruscus TaxID=42192 RepID=A0A6J8BUZ8_MYTCO|nr:unnamed protein product [Mytilus coruscus]
MWCLECCKSFFANCKEEHDSSNASINHNTILEEEYIKLPIYPKLTLHCEKHNKKYEKFCPDHHLLLCKKCIKTTHKTCKDVLSLEEVTHNTKSSGVVEHMKTSIDDIQLTLQKIKQSRNENLTSVRTQIKDIQKEISRFRSQLNKTLDKMEKELMEEMEKVEYKTKRHMAILFKDLQQHEHKIKEIKRGIEGLEKYGTDFKTFLAGNQSENVVHQEKKYMQSLLDQKKT